jgi:hypothetical protein
MIMDSRVEFADAVSVAAAPGTALIGRCSRFGHWRDTLSRHFD